jgi:hypothetical protein
VSGPPPSRYRVVERGRRLVVLDMWNGGSPVSHAPPAKVSAEAPRRDAPVTNVAAETLDMRGRAIVTTSRLYDLKGPRRITVDLQHEEKIKTFKVMIAVAAILFVATALVWPWLFVPAALVLIQPRARNWMRAQATDWLDGADQAADGSGSSAG